MRYTCLLCQTVLFNKPKTPQFMDGARLVDINNQWLHLIDDSVEAEKFVKNVWGNLWLLFQYSAVYDADIEEQSTSKMIPTRQILTCKQSMKRFAKPQRTTTT
jgi:hypothetical protein